MKNITVILICLILFSSLNFSGYSKSDESFYIPRLVACIDSQSNLNIFWGGYSDNNYIKLDSNGQILKCIEKLQLKPGGPDIDSEDNLHQTRIEKYFDKKDEFYYSKLDNNGNILIQERKIFDMPDEFGYYPLIDNFDNQDNLHIMFRSEKGAGKSYPIYYLKLDKNGEKLVEPDTIKINNREIIWQDSNWSLAYPKLKLDSKNNVHIIGENIYLNFNSTTNKWIEIYNISGRFLEIDHKDDLHVFAQNQHHIIIRDKKIITDKKISSAIINSTHLLIDSNYNYHSVQEKSDEIIYKEYDENGTLKREIILRTESSNEDIHIRQLIFDKEENIYIFWVLSNEYDVNDEEITKEEIHYSKLDKNGNVIFKDKRIIPENADKSSRYQIDFILLETIFFMAIVATLIIYYKIYKKTNKK